MKHYVPSLLFPKETYATEDVVRIVNQKQCMLYIKSGLYPLDMYTSIDKETGKDVLVMVFSKEESYPLYQKWCDYELK